MESREKACPHFFDEAGVDYEMKARHGAWIIPPENDINAELGDFVPEALGQRLYGELAGSVDAEEGERHPPQDRSDVDDQTIARAPHARQDRARRT